MERGRAATGRKERMKGLVFNRYVQILLRIIIGGIFIYAGILKIRSPQEFADHIAGFQLLPNGFVNILAIGLPVFEVIVGLALVMGFQSRTAAFCVLFLSIMFAVAMASAMTRGLQIDCGCFGSGSPSILKMWLSLGRDVLLVVAAFVIWMQSIQMPSGEKA
jgi:putative oxidoreductase